MLLTPGISRSKLEVYSLVRVWGWSSVKMTKAEAPCHHLTQMKLDLFGRPWREHSHQIQCQINLLAQTIGRPGRTETPTVVRRGGLLEPCDISAFGSDCGSPCIMSQTFWLNSCCAASAMRLGGLTTAQMFLRAAHSGATPRRQLE